MMGKLLFRLLFIWLLAFPKISIAQNNDLMVIDFEYDDPAKGFKMQVPSDWDVKKSYLGYALFMEPKTKELATPAKPIVTDPNISVAVFSTPQFIDDRTLDEYEKELSAKFKETNGDIPFQVFSKSIVDLPGGNKGLLYYISFNNNGLDIVSAILVMSSSTLSYRVTFTDEKVGFEKQFEKYFPVLASIQINSPSPTRAGFIETYWPGIAVLIVLLGVSLFIYNVRKKRQDALITEVSGDAPESRNSKGPVDEDSIYKDPDGSYKSINESFSVHSAADFVDEEGEQYDADSNPFSEASANFSDKPQSSSGSKSKSGKSFKSGMSNLSEND